mmetsp:Transcript_4912/g.7449  ORF Transcript_4912/g.7449 Transcript_4912/m.7449 type:complete len:258 (-) Transcript_4912:169-942(-)|eukprot:CAMPEP_0195281544 /NCGR_PEP_ID=MMETSP0707-20130614/811_1 /TAXON_ID=33640 /ORGANISM="Asterionellopsis glacialis, Strain CCMP134" /LENGTH=257 /DNA_ID=CAMNT_0040340443 /DNA_START=40 /DNA_END=813 /DNA_ORIENTATION=+
MMKQDLSYNKPTEKGTKTPQKKAKERKFKRPLSAYNIFFREERARILTDALLNSGDAVTPEQLEQALQTGPDRPHRKAHGKISFIVLVRTVGQRWRSLSTAEKAVYEHMASRERVRFHIKHASIKESHQENLNLFQKDTIQKFKNSTSTSDGVNPDDLYSLSRPTTLSDATIISDELHCRSQQIPTLRCDGTTLDCLPEPTPLRTNGQEFGATGHTSEVEEMLSTPMNQVLLQDLSRKLDVESMTFIQSCFTSFNHS